MLPTQMEALSEAVNTLKKQLNNANNEYLQNCDWRARQRLLGHSKHFVDAMTPTHPIQVIFTMMLVHCCKIYDLR